MDLYTQSDLYCAAFDYPVNEDVRWAVDTCRLLMGRIPRTVLEPMCGNARYAADFIGHGLHYGDSIFHRTCLIEQMHAPCRNCSWRMHVNSRSTGHVSTWRGARSIRYGIFVKRRISYDIFDVYPDIWLMTVCISSKPMWLDETE